MKFVVQGYRSTFITVVCESQNNFGGESTLLLSEVFLSRHGRLVSVGRTNVAAIGQSL
jgi:hypothetical protein